MARDPYLVAIDVGSNSIKLAVVKDSLDEQDKVQVLALVERPSNGVRKGMITNMSDATEALIDIINQAEGIIGLPIRRGVVGVSGMGITFTNSEGLIVISRNDNEIVDSDVDRVIQDSLTKAFGLNNNEIIHVIPKSFSVDNQYGIRYPVGMIGSKLEIKTLVVSVESSYLRNFTKVFDQASIEIYNQVYTPLASGDFLLTLRQKKAGTMLVDIGYSSTSFIVWENEEIVGSGVIPIGSDHITADLAVGLQTTIEMAEEIKKQHLNLSNEIDSDIDEIEMYNQDLQINETFKFEEIRLYARARSEEIFAFINRELKKIGKSGKLPGGAVLIGGGSSIQGIDDVARGVLRLPIFKYHFDKNVIDFVPDYNGDPAFINCISLASYSLYHAEELQSSKQRQSTRTTTPKAESTGFLSQIRKILPWG